MYKTKKGFIELCARVFSGEYEKTLSQINIEMVLKGEEQFLLEPKHLKQKNITLWVLGFVAGNSHNDELVNSFEYGLKHNWFFGSSDNPDTEYVFETALDDLLCKDRRLYSIISDHYITNFTGFESIGKRIKIAYGLALTELPLEKLLELKKEH